MVSKHEDKVGRFRNPVASGLGNLGFNLSWIWLHKLVIISHKALRSNYTIHGLQFNLCWKRREGGERQWENSYILVFIKLFVMFLDFISIQQQCECGFGDFFYFYFQNFSWLIRSEDPACVPKENFVKMLYNSIHFNFFFPTLLTYSVTFMIWVLQTKSWGKQSSLAGQTK